MVTLIGGLFEQAKFFFKASLRNYICKSASNQSKKYNLVGSITMAKSKPKTSNPQQKFVNGKLVTTHLINVSDLKMLDKPIHETLPDALKERSAKVYHDVGYLLFKSYTVWDKNTRTDMNPEKEIIVWENINLVFQEFCKITGVTDLKIKKIVAGSIMGLTIGHPISETEISKHPIYALALKQALKVWPAPKHDLDKLPPIIPN